MNTFILSLLGICIYCCICLTISLLLSPPDAQFACSLLLILKCSIHRSLFQETYVTSSRKYLSVPPNHYVASQVGVGFSCALPQYLLHCLQSPVPLFYSSVACRLLDSCVLLTPSSLPQSLTQCLYWWVCSKHWMLIFNPLSCFSPRPFFPPSISRVGYTQVLVTQLCLTLCDPVDCSPPGSSVHGILQARILEWVAIPFSRGSSWPRDWTRLSHTAGRFFRPEEFFRFFWATRGALYSMPSFISASLLFRLPLDISGQDSYGFRAARPIRHPPALTMFVLFGGTSYHQPVLLESLSIMATWFPRSCCHM